jgi:hypothetical protein
MSAEDKLPAIPPGQANWGDLRRQEPLCSRWGFGRGQPVDRYYIENFLARHSGAIGGSCLEVMNSNYTHRFGQDRITHSDVVDIDSKNTKANIVGDLIDPSTLPANRYDCFILTQTLSVIYDGRAVMRNCYAALKPGGTMLVTAACMCRYSPHPEDFWRLTDRSLTRLITENTDCEDFEVEAHGNLITSMAFLMGMASEELSQEELDHQDFRFPIVVTARLRKRQQPPKQPNP